MSREHINTAFSKETGRIAINFSADVKRRCIQNAIETIKIKVDFKMLNRHKYMCIALFESIFEETGLFCDESIVFERFRPENAIKFGANPKAAQRELWWPDTSEKSQRGRIEFLKWLMSQY